MQESLKTFQELVEKLPDIIARFDRELRHLYVNPAVELATGIPPDHFIGKTNEEMGMPENLCSFWAERMKKVFIAGQPDKFEFDFQAPDGSKSYQSFIVPEFSEDGSVETILVSARDITEQRQTEHLLQKTLDRLDMRIQEQTAKLEETNKNLSCEIEERIKAEEVLHKREKEYRDLFINAMVGIFRSTPDGKYLRVNPALAKIHGFDSPEEMINMVTNIGEQLYVHPQDRKRYMGLLENADAISNFEAQLYRKDKSKVWITMNVKAIRSLDGSIDCFEGIVEDITSRRQAEETLNKTMEKLRKSLAGTIQAMSLTVETRDPYTAGHQKRVSNLARTIAREMGLSADMTDNIRMAGNVHDIGKISIPAEILVKPTRLTDIEMSLIKVHPRAGYDILKDAELPYPIAEMVLQHHERLNGSGYPMGLIAENILLEAKILSVADVVEAIATHRPYRPAVGIDAALDEIEKNKGILYDERVVDVCIKLFREKKFGFE